MQAAGMLRGTRAVCLLVSLVFLIGYAHSLPLQFLPSIPGYIPVYIRHGDEPLEDINPALAEAFHEESSLSKNVLPAKVPDPVDLSFEEENETFNDKLKNKNIYPVHVRQVESGASDSKEKESNKATEKTPESETPKLLTIYELRDDTDDKRGHREKSKKKNAREPVVKVAPLTEEEKETLGKLAIQVEKQENKVNEVHKSDTNLLKLPTDLPHQPSNVHNLGPILKVDPIVINESVGQPGFYLKELPGPATDKEETSASSTEDEEPPVKVELPENVFLNVEKLSPIPLPEKSENKGSSQTEEIHESNTESEKKDVTERNEAASTN